VDNKGVSTTTDALADGDMDDKEKWRFAQRGCNASRRLMLTILRVTMKITRMKMKVRTTIKKLFGMTNLHF